MNEYLLLFRNAAGENAYLSTPEDMARDMPRWQQWIGNIAAQGKLIHTAPIRFEGSQLNQNGQKTSGPHKENGHVLVSGYLLCKAESQEEAETWAASCPILVYPSSSVEVRPLIPFPVG